MVTIAEIGIAISVLAFDTKVLVYPVARRGSDRVTIVERGL